MPIIEDNPISDLKGQIVDLFNTLDPGKERDKKISKVWEELDKFTPEPLNEVPYIFGLTIKRPRRR